MRHWTNLKKKKKGKSMKLSASILQYQFSNVEIRQQQLTKPLKCCALSDGNYTTLNHDQKMFGNCCSFITHFRTLQLRCIRQWRSRTIHWWTTSYNIRIHILMFYRLTSPSDVSHNCFSFSSLNTCFLSKCLEQFMVWLSPWWWKPLLISERK